MYSIGASWSFPVVIMMMLTWTYLQVKNSNMTECNVFLFKCPWNLKYDAKKNLNLRLLSGGVNSLSLSLCVTKTTVPFPFCSSCFSFYPSFSTPPRCCSSPHSCFFLIFSSSSSLYLPPSSPPPGCCSAVGFHGCYVLRCSPNHAVLLPLLLLHQIDLSALLSLHLLLLLSSLLISSDFPCR